MPALALSTGSIIRLAYGAGRIRVDRFVLCLAGTIVLATLLPCDGPGARIFHGLAVAAIATLFFLQGARLSREAVLNGIAHWRLHGFVSSITFVFFPLLGLTLHALVPGALPAPLWIGMMFLCALSSTVQSSIALTSIAGGNVAGAVCSATMSSLAGIVLTPLLFGMLSSLEGGAIDTRGIWRIVLQLLLPFAAGHLLRPWAGQWAARNRSLLSVTDRGSILLVVYTAFSAAVVHGVWNQVPAGTLACLFALAGVLLASGLAVAVIGSRMLGFSPEDEVAAVFCASQKSLVSGVPIASALFGAAAIGPVLLPIMIYHPLQLVVCAWIAKRYAAYAAPPASAEMERGLPAHAPPPAA